MIQTQSTTPNTPRDAYQRIRLPKPHSGQRMVRQQMRRFNWLCAGRRWRKTTTGLSVAVEHAVHGGNYVWGAPTFKQVRVGWDEMRRACAGVVEFNESRMDATFPDTGHGRGRIEFVSLDIPDNARGKTAHGVIIDEASEVPARAWQEILRPMLMDTNGWMLAMFTPKGRNWTWQEVMNSQYGDDPESMSWQIPSLGCRVEETTGELVREPHTLENPELRFSELQYMFETMPRRTFQQEILAEFLDDAGGVFRGVEGCVSGEELLAAPPSTVYQYVIGIDLAKHVDYTVLCVGDLRARQVVAFDRFNKADWGLQKTRIVELAKRWNNALIWMDSTGIGDVVYDDLYHAGLRIQPYKFTAASKEQLINNAVLMVEQQQIHYPRIPVLLDELKSLQYTRRESGGYRIEAPEGMHDDAVMAFCLMCWPMGHNAGATLSSHLLADLYGGGHSASDLHGVRLLGRTF